MELVTLTKENLAREHICCAIANEKDAQVAAKKAWLCDRLDDGLVFTKGDVRGKCFIEYIPAERAWAPVEAAGYMYIDCFWVSGQYKGQGNADRLLAACVADSRTKGKRGLVALSSEGKRPFLSDPDYLRHRGFLPADTAEPYFTLLYLPFEPSAARPQFRDTVKRPAVQPDGFTLYYSSQCPYTAKYVPLIEAVAQAAGLPFRAVRFQTAVEAQSAPSPFTAYSLFYNGAFVTHEILSEKRFQKMIEEKTAG